MELSQLPYALNWKYIAYLASTANSWTKIALQKKLKPKLYVQTAPQSQIKTDSFHSFVRSFAEHHPILTKSNFQKCAPIFSPPVASIFKPFPKTWRVCKLTINRWCTYNCGLVIRFHLEKITIKCEQRLICLGQFRKAWPDLNFGKQTSKNAFL